MTSNKPITSALLLFACMRWSGEESRKNVTCTGWGGITNNDNTKQAISVAYTSVGQTLRISYFFCFWLHELHVLCHSLNGNVFTARRRRNTRLQILLLRRTPMPRQLSRVSSSSVAFWLIVLDSAKTSCLTLKMM
jgi:hypothetical protein